VKGTTPLSGVLVDARDADLWTGCDFGCRYCLPDLRHFGSKFAAPAGEGIFQTKIQPRTCDALNLKGLTMRLRSHPELWWGKTPPAFLSLRSDCYPKAEERLGFTRRAISVLHYYRVGVRILTRSGQRAVRDFQPRPGTRLLAPEAPPAAGAVDFASLRFADGSEPLPNLGSHPDDAYGATLTFLDAEQSRKWEPRAALPAERMAGLEEAHRRGIQTVVYLIPTVDPAAALEVIRAAHEFVDFFFLGPIIPGFATPEFEAAFPSFDWPEFAREAIDLCEGFDVPAYAKRVLTSDPETLSRLREAVRTVESLADKDERVWGEYLRQTALDWTAMAPAECAATIEEGGEDWYGIEWPA
jgi:DNA repair photolyase